MEWYELYLIAWFVVAVFVFVRDIISKAGKGVIDMERAHTLEDESREITESVFTGLLIGFFWWAAIAIWLVALVGGIIFFSLSKIKKKLAEKEYIQGK